MALGFDYELGTGSPLLGQEVLCCLIATAVAVAFLSFSLLPLISEGFSDLFEVIEVNVSPIFKFPLY